MENPGLRTLISFLRRVGERAPANFSSLCEDRGKGYGMVSRYLGWCLEKGLIRVVEVRRTRGRYPSKTYGLTVRGRRLLELFEDQYVQGTAGMAKSSGPGMKGAPRGGRGLQGVEDRNINL